MNGPQSYLQGRLFSVATFMADMESDGLLFAADEGGRLYWYRDGWWQPGESVAREFVAATMGDQYAMSQSNTLVDVLRHRAPQIGVSDPDVGLVNVANGMLDWQAGTLLPHRADLFSTAQLPVRWNPEATCPTVDAFLDEVLAGDADMVRLAWEIVGYSMIDGNPLQKGVWLVGDGQNGKGAFLRVLTGLLGKRNVSNVMLQQLDGDRARFNAARLFGMKANIGADIPATYLQDTALIKQITGEDRIQMERKYEHQFDAEVTALMLFSMNEMPQTSDRSHGFYRRWLIVPFDVTVTPDPTIEQRMGAELEGVLVKATDALRSLMGQQRPAFTAAKRSLDAAADYRRVSDPVATFVEELVAPQVAATVTRATVYRSYKEWSDDRGYRALSAAKFHPHFRNVLAEVYGPPVELVQMSGQWKERQASGVRGYEGISVDGLTVW